VDDEQKTKEQQIDWAPVVGAAERFVEAVKFISVADSSTDADELESRWADFNTQFVIVAAAFGVLEWDTSNLFYLKKNGPWVSTFNEFPLRQIDYLIERGTVHLWKDRVTVKTLSVDEIVKKTGLSRAHIEKQIRLRKMVPTVGGIDTYLKIAHRPKNRRNSTPGQRRGRAKHKKFMSEI